MVIEVVPAIRVASLATAPSETLESCLYVHAWLSAEVEGDRRSGHLHLVAEVAAGEVGEPEWRGVDLAGVTFGVDKQPGLDLPSYAVSAFDRWAGCMELVLYRARNAGLLSEIGEDANVFRRRITSTLRPEMDAEMVRLEGEANPVLVGSHQRSESERREARAHLAQGLAEFAGGIEAIRCGTVRDLTRRATLCVLRCPKSFPFGERPAVLVPAE